MERRIHVKPSHTLLVVTPWQIARLDFSGTRRPKLQQIWSVPCSSLSASLDDPSTNSVADESLSFRVAKAIQLGPKRLGKVTLVSTQFWTDVISLPADVTTLANPNELHQALAIEAELDSGVSPFDSQLACYPLPNNNLNGLPFCVTQISNLQLVELQQLIQSRNGCLQQLAHPIATIPLSNLDSQESTVRLLEQWTLNPIDGDAVFDKSAEEKLDSIANGFVEQLSQQKFSSLWLKPVQEPKLQQLIALGAAFAVAVLICCVGVYLHSENSVAAIRQSNASSQRQLEAYESTSANIQQLEKELVKLRAEEHAARQSRETALQRARLVSSHRQQINARWGMLFNAIATNSGDCWIRSIDSDNDQTTLRGISIDHSQAHSFAARLENALLNSGWTVSPASTRFVANSLCEFSIMLSWLFSGTADEQLRPTIVQGDIQPLDLRSALAVNQEVSP